MFRITKNLCLMALLAMLAISLAGCHRTDAEQQVRESIAAVAEAAEAGSASDIGKALSEDFDGNQGDLDRRGLLNMVRVLTLRGEHIGVTLGPVSVEPRGERLVATFTVSLSSGSGSLLPDRLGVYQVETAWREEQGEWLCYVASWKR